MSLPLSSGSSRWPSAAHSGRSLSIVIGVVLVVIIAAGLWGAYAGFTRVREGARRRPRQKMPFRCTQCSHEFAMTPREFADQAAKEDLAGKPLGLANCPSCGKKQCCRRMVQCQQCSKLYIPWGSGESASGRPVCPHCKAELAGPKSTGGRRGL